MATFREQVEGLTQLTMAGSLTPSLDELNSFLQEGLKEVVNRIISIKPSEMAKFTSTTALEDDNGLVITGQIVSVAREHSSTSILRPCGMINPADRYEATDSSSLKYRSKYNPGFFILNGKVYIRPIATDTGNNRGQITQVAYDTGLTHGDNPSQIENFPDEYSYLIALNASIKTLFAYMGELDEELPADITLPSMPLAPVPLPISASAPSAPSLSDSSISFNSALLYNAPTLSLSTFPTITWNFPTTPTVPAIADNSIASLDNAPTYTPPQSFIDIAAIDTYINDDDPEMADKKKDKASLEIAKYQADIQNELNNFNKANAIYAAETQKKIQDATLSAGDDNQKIQKYQAEVQAYVSEVTKIVQDNQGQIAEWQNESTVKIQEYSAKLTNSVNEFNKSNSEYQAELQRVLQEAQLISADDTQKIQKYSADIQDYTARINKEVQDNQSKLTVYTAESQAYNSEITGKITDFNAKIQKYNTKYQWAQARYTSLRQEYNEAFGLMAPPKQQNEGEK